MHAREGRLRRLWLGARAALAVSLIAGTFAPGTPFFAREAHGVAWAGPGGPPVPSDHSPEITRGELEGWVRLLADDSFEGRESGEPGCDRAADLIAAEFARVGLRPLGDRGSFFQNFTIPRGMKVLKETSLSATSPDGKTVAFRLAEDFVPVDVSTSGDVTGSVVFAGYGIRAPDLGYDDYEGVDVKGKVVVVLRRAPAYEDRKSPFSAPAVLEKHASFQAKAEAAAAAGAAALVIVNDPATSTTKEKDDLKAPGGGTAGKIPVVQVAWRGSGKRLGDALGLSLTRLQGQIDAKGMPRSACAEGATLHVRCALEPDVRAVRNVAGLLVPERTGATTGETPPAGAPCAPDSPRAPPAGAGDAPARETVIMGAHYDHVGRGHFGSLANAEGKIHNGADDNASGTSALLETAGWLASRRAEISRNVLFLAFSGEELGLLGSKRYVESPLLPLCDCVAMVNLDMVGRLDERLFVGGTGTSPVWPDLLERLNRETVRLPLKMWPGGKAPSDHETFYGRDLPVLFFFTGLHPDYHRPSDDWNTLNYDGHTKVTRLAASVAFDLASRKDRPAFTKCDAGGFEVGPYLGAGVAARAAGTDGVVVSHVDDKGPAKKAGLKEGDILLEWNGAPVKDPNVFNDLLSKTKQGDKSELSIERKGRKLKVTVTIGST